MTVYRSKCLRDYLVSAVDAAAFLKVTRLRFHHLVEDGFIPRESRKGFFRLGDVLDGYAAFVRSEAGGGLEEAA